MLLDFARSAFQRIKVSLINTQPYTVTYIYHWGQLIEHGVDFDRGT